MSQRQGCLLVLAAVAAAALLVWLVLPVPPKTPSAALLLQEAAAIRIEQESVRAGMTATLADEGLLPPDYDAMATLAAYESTPYRALTFLVDALLEEEGALSRETLAELDARLALFRDAGNLTPLEHALDPARGDAGTLQGNMLRYLGESEDMRRLEIAMDHGLCIVPPYADWTGRNKRALDLAVSLFAARASLQCDATDYGAAVASLARAYAVPSSAVASEHYSAVWNTANRLADPVLWRLADRAILTPEQRDVLVAAVGRRPTAEDMALSMRIYAGSEVVCGTIATAPLGLSKIREWRTGQPGGVREREVRGLLDTVARQAAFLDRPPYEVPLLRAGSSTTRMPSRGLSKARILYRQYWASALRTEVLRTVFSLKDYKKAAGAYPERLDEATLKAPLDFLTGAPLQYERRGDGFEILSSGAPREEKDAAGWRNALLWCAER